MSTSGPSWYAVQTHPHSEAKAASHLERQGYTIYLPRYLKRRRHARKVEMIAAPLFPRYLFVAVDLETQRWRAIHSTSGGTGAGSSPLHTSRDTPMVDWIERHLCESISIVTKR